MRAVLACNVVQALLAGQLLGACRAGLTRGLLLSCQFMAQREKMDRSRHTCLKSSALQKSVWSPNRMRRPLQGWQAWECKAYVCVLLWSIHATQRMRQCIGGCSYDEQQQAGRQQAFQAGRRRSPQEGQRAQQQRQVVALQRVVR